MKIRYFMCRECKEETKHRVRRVSFKSHGGNSRGGVKYTLEHCCKCNKRWYDGKPKRNIESRRGGHKKI